MSGPKHTPGPVITKGQLLDRMEGVARRSNKVAIAHILAEIADDVLAVITTERRHEQTRCANAVRRVGAKIEAEADATAYPANEVIDLAVKAISRGRR